MKTPFAKSLSIRLFTCALTLLISASYVSFAHPPKNSGPPKAAPIPRYEPAKSPVVTGEFIVGIINVTFKETLFPEDIQKVQGDLEQVIGTHFESDPTGGNQASETSNAVNQEEYFKIYSNGITWPKMVMMPDQKNCYEDPNFYGYYCEYDAFTNPMGWENAEEGEERVKKMNQNAMRFAAKNYRGPKPRFFCYNYITIRPEAPDEEITNAICEFFPGQENRKERIEKNKKLAEKDAGLVAEEFDPWEYYAPVCKWGEPAWPNSKIQINDFAGGVLAHELGHCLGAPDVYRVGRFNDGIGGNASLLPYGPTANAFSRFYHHAFIKEENHPTIQTSGSYTLHPRHIKPAGKEALGYLIPSNHPHYMYHVEYLHQESSSVGVGPAYEGMLISVINFGLTNYTGSPDYTYVYRPNDPFFRGLGDTDKCLFGKAHGRTEFNMTTEPSSRLPNLIDGGVSFKNIEEKNGTLTFDVSIERKTISGSEYTNSMLPQIRLDEIVDVQATSFTMDCTIKFRGEPLKTNYGFCWSTNKNPTIEKSRYVLAHRECYRGHAINLDPSTTYYIRAFASNGLGIRYSDEEKTIKTLDKQSTATEIKPLFTDSFSNNEYLIRYYSDGSSARFVDYSFICAMAKLIAYYQPDRVASLDKKSLKKSVVDFNQLNWNPAADHPKARLAQTDGFFTNLYSDIAALKLHDEKLPKKITSGISKLTNFKSKPVHNLLEDANTAQVSDLIKSDLSLSRPVLLMFFSNDVSASEAPHWTLIDGINKDGHFHVDYPSGTNIFANGEQKDMETGFYPIEELIFPGYTIHVITSCYSPK